MLFNTGQYGAFFIVVFCLHWALPKSLRRPLLLAASYFFYASAIPQYLLLIVGLTLFNYLLGLWIHRAHGRARLAVLWLAIAGNLGSLAYFKYTGLVVSTLRQALAHLPLLDPLLNDPLLTNVLLPLGISFFTFEFIHYVVEIYKGSDPMRNLGDFALFAAFFPTQIAGPIKRFPDWVKQLQHPLHLREIDFDGGLWLIARGLVKKVVVADTLAPAVAANFATPGALGPGTAWFSVFAFATQIYCDFSGYTDIGRGCATLLGYSVPLNFTAPYQSKNPGEFWHHWHMSLSSWLRDYLYIPLGGSRVPQPRIYLNLMITMALGGLWHGASWHFMIWGIYQGVLLCVDRLWGRSVGTTNVYQSVIRTPIFDFIRRPITLVLVCIGWVFFRADTVSGALQMFRSMLAFSRPLNEGWSGSKATPPVFLVVVAAAVVLVGWVWSVVRERQWGKWVRSLLETKSDMIDIGVLYVGRPVLLASAVLVVLAWPPHTIQSFIYFRF